MKKITISIITVTYNNLIGLQGTLESVAKQSFENYEHIVIDGKSNDGSVELLDKQADNEKLVCLSESDSGIFNAMNKGISLAEGGWLLFLNAGDIFASDKTLENLESLGVLGDPKLDLIFGDKLDPVGNLIKANKNLSCLYVGEMPACHQSILFRNNIHYDESFRIYGDIDLLSKIYLSSPNYRYVEIPISIFEGGGVSSVVSWVKRKEKFRSLYNNFGFLCLLRNYIFNVNFYKKIFIWK